MDPQHPGVEPTRQYLQLLSDSKRQNLPINAAALRDRDPMLAQALVRLGHAARSGDCRTIITTGSDLDYRWIYQSMANAPGEIRIRAQFELGAPNRVTLLCQA